MTAKDYAIKLLSFCDRSEKEIREKLSKKGYSPSETEEAIAFCREYGYINDERYAAHFVHDAVELKKLGKARIRMELKQKGIEEEAVTEALEAIGDEFETVKAQMQKRFGNLDFADKKVRNKVFGYFARRGFSPRDILSAMNVDEEGYDE